MLRLTANYIAAIILFTLITRIILIPLSLWVQKNGIKMVKMMPELNRLKITYYGDKETIAEKTQELYKAEKYQPLASTIPLVIQIVLLMGVVAAVKSLLGTSGDALLQIPSEVGGWTLLMPLAAGLASLLLTLAQNKLGPLQREQQKAEKIITGAISVGISLFLGAFVSVGTCIYWICSNLMAIPLQLLYNVLVNPKKYVDYAALEKSKKELEAISDLGAKVSKEDNKRERADYKRFFSIANKHIVFYSEKSGFYKYFRPMIEYILEHSNASIHYVTNDPNDQVFELANKQPQIKPYYIGPQKIITFMMKMDADIVAMTTPDLEKYYLKRSYVRKDIEYVYVPHGITSTNLTTQKGAYDHFDTILCAGQYQVNEVRETEEMYNLPSKTLVPCGYGMLDELIRNIEQAGTSSRPDGKKQILIAPSWQQDNILDSCINELIEQLYGDEYVLIVRPHPEYVKRYGPRMQQLIDQHKDKDPEKLIFETDFSVNTSIYSADLLITDWSAISFEYAFASCRPVLSINTPMKVTNPDYVKYKNQPIDITLRDQIGRALNLDELAQTRRVVDELLENPEAMAAHICQIRDANIFNVGHFGEAAGKYLLTRMIERSKKGAKKADTEHDNEEK